GRQLRGTDRADDLQRLRNLPATAVLHFSARRTGGGRAGGWGQLLDHLPADRAAPVTPNPGGARGILLPGQLELLRLADDDHVGAGPASGPAGRADVPAAVRG